VLHECCCRLDVLWLWQPGIQLLLLLLLLPASAPTQADSPALSDLKNVSLLMRSVAGVVWCSCGAQDACSRGS
jgi:hypothetical protein